MDTNSIIKNYFPVYRFYVSLFIELWIHEFVYILTFIYYVLYFSIIS